MSPNFRSWVIIFALYGHATTMKASAGIEGNVDSLGRLKISTVEGSRRGLGGRVQGNNGERIGVDKEDEDKYLGSEESSDAASEVDGQFIGPLVEDKTEVKPMKMTSSTSEATESKMTSATSEETESQMTSTSAEKSQDQMTSKANEGSQNTAAYEETRNQFTSTLASEHGSRSGLFIVGASILYAAAACVAVLISTQGKAHSGDDTDKSTPLFQEGIELSSSDSSISQRLERQPSDLNSTNRIGDDISVSTLSKLYADCI
uniref:Uncharacterized protein n=1 Tax=Corethron hystrix TaxID=216773 RepID=A0A7S1FRM7_9STRA